jgi:hypothetical protein
LMGYGKQSDTKVNGIDFSYLYKYKTTSNVFDLVVNKNLKLQGTDAGTLSTYVAKNPTILNKVNKKQGKNYNVTFQFLDVLDINLYSSTPDDDPSFVILRDVLDYNVYRKSSPNSKKLSQQLRERRQEKQQMYMSNLQKAQKALITQPAFKSALKTFTQMRARNMRAK